MNAMFPLEIRQQIAEECEKQGKTVEESIEPLKNLSLEYYQFIREMLGLPDEGSDKA